MCGVFGAFGAKRRKNLRCYRDRPIPCRGGAQAQGLLSYFSRIFTCTEVGAGKEHPDIFLQAMDFLGEAQEDTVVFEDAYYAIKTAKKAGFYVVAMADETAREDEADILRVADEFHEDYSDVQIEKDGRRLSVGAKMYTGVSGVRKSGLAAQENGERLLCVNRECPEFLCASAYFAQGLPGAMEEIYIRQGALERLQKAAASLPEGYRFKLWDIWRPVALQQAIFDRYAAEIAEKNPGISEEALFLETSKFVFPPGDERCSPLCMLREARWT